MWLSSRELEELTGYKRPSFQRKWLTLYGWHYATDRDGKPVVSKEYAKARLSGKQGVGDYSLGTIR